MEPPKGLPPIPDHTLPVDYAEVLYEPDAEVLYEPDAEGKSHKEALRCLKRRVSDAVFRSLMADSLAPSSSAA